MTRLVVTPTTRSNLTQLIATHSLPSDTRRRVAPALEPLRRHLRIGPVLPSGTVELRFVLGPWPWMIIVYRLDEPADTVVVLAIQDARSATSIVSRPST